MKDFYSFIELHGKAINGFFILLITILPFYIFIATKWPEIYKTMGTTDNTPSQTRLQMFMWSCTFIDAVFCALAFPDRMLPQWLYVLIATGAGVMVVAKVIGAYKDKPGVDIVKSEKDKNDE